MTTPDFKIDPSRDSQAIRAQEAEKKRKPPTRDFAEVTEQVDERRQNPEEENPKVKKKKQGDVAAFGQKEGADDKPAVNVFTLIGGTLDNEDESPASDQQYMVDGLVDKKTLKGQIQREHQLDGLEDQPSKIKFKKQENFGAIEQPDLAAVPQPTAPKASPFASFVENVSLDKQTQISKIQAFQDLITQMVDQAKTIETKDQKLTVITLGGNFQGARLIMSEYSTAPFQVNITIENLTMAQQHLLEMNKETLLNDLSRKQVTVHIFTVTTQENTIKDVALGEEKRGGGREFGQRDEGNKEQKKR